MAFIERSRVYSWLADNLASDFSTSRHCPRSQRITGPSPLEAGALVATLSTSSVCQLSISDNAESM